MDKSTLSNYGWIVIAVLVLAVMIALATPFGEFIEAGVKSATQGLFDVSDSSMNVGLSSVGIKNTYDCGHERTKPGEHSKKECGHYACENCGCVPATCGISGHWSGDGLDHTTTVNHTGHTLACQCNGWIIPEDGTYTRSNGIVYNAGEQLPCGYVTKSNDIYTYGDYKYTYQSNGWQVAINTAVTDKNQTTYGAILEGINGKPVTNMNYTFRDCKELTTAPAIPSSVTNMNYTFRDCKELTTAPAIPSNVTDMEYTFSGCTSLVTAPDMSNATSVTNMSHTFNVCTSLTTAPDMSNATSVTNMFNTFNGCTSLVDLSDFFIPSSVTNMAETFSGCTSLVTAPAIPSSVTDMSRTFQGCASLETAPAIPSGVTNMVGTFGNCRSLTTAPVIPNSVTDMTSTFSFCDTLTGEISIPCSLANQNYTYTYCPATITYYHIDSCDGSCGQ